MGLRICFVLPGSSPRPSGGVKIIYEHANRLVQKGHSVNIVHTAFVQRGDPVKMVRGTASYLLNRIGVMQWRPDNWFSVDTRVGMHWVPTLHERWVPDADVVVASAWQTAEWVARYSSRKGRRFYFIQDYERYMEAGPELRQRIATTYNGGLRNLVISPACREIVETNGGVVYGEIPNGLDFEKLEMELAVEHSLRKGIGFPNRPERFKGTRDAIKAIAIIRSRTGHAGPYWCFGGERPAFLPEWVEHHPRPSDAELAALYNRTSIFVVPSHYEGWGLPGSEAMACGAALVSTDNGGVRAYAEAEKTALFAPIGDPEALAAAACSLLDDDARRVELARHGCESVRNFTWERSSRQFEWYLLQT